MKAKTQTTRSMTTPTNSPILWLAQILAQARAAEEAAEDARIAAERDSSEHLCASRVEEHASDAAMAAETLLSCFRPQSEAEAAVLSMILAGNAGCIAEATPSDHFGRQVRRLSRSVGSYLVGSCPLPDAIKRYTDDHEDRAMWFAGDAPLVAPRKETA